MPNESSPDPLSRAESALPPAFVSRMRDQLGTDHANQAMIASAHRTPRGVRFNPLRDAPENTRRRLEDAGVSFQNVPWCGEACVIDPEHLPLVLEHPTWKEGAIHVQSLPSIAAAIALAPQPGERILDLCAAPGGKTSHIAALMNNQGEIIANDRSRARSHRMRALLNQLGAHAVVRTHDGTGIGRHEPASFDRVLVDAPCSGEGRFDLHNPSTIDDWTVSKTRRLGSLQKSLLHSAISAVRPGGVIVYSTCTYGRLENEAVVERALARYGEGPTGVELDSIPMDLPTMHDPLGLEAPAGSIIRSLPDPEGDQVAQAMEGFFMARFRRRAR